MIKKAFAFVAVSLLLIVSGCNKTNTAEIEVKANGFSCKALVDYNDISLESELRIEQNGIFSATITSPETLCGMKCEWNGEKVKLSYLGIEKELDTDALPYFNYASTIREILSNVGYRVTAEKMGNGYEYNGNCEKGKYTVLFRADGFPIKFELPSADLTVELSDFEYIYNS